MNHRDRSSTDPRRAAEALFRKATEKPPERVAAAAAPALPNAKEQVTLRLDRAVLEHFQAAGPGWQDRINAALRTASGL